MGGAGVTRRGRVGPWAASVLVHSAVALGLLRAVGENPAGRSVEPPIELQVEIGAPTPRAAPIEAASIERAPSTSGGPPAPLHGDRPRSPSASPRPAPSAEPVTPEVTEPSRCSGRPPASSPTVSLDPRSVALRALLGDEARVDEPPAKGGDGDRGGSRDLDESLRAFADRGRAELSTRPAPVLRPTPDGGYRYEGSGPLSARIAPDGRLSFEVHGRIDPELGVATDLATGRAWPTIQLRPNLDLNDAVAAIAGEDPLAPEKAWFARETEVLRERLAARARAVEVEAALESLRGRLEAIAGDGGLDPARRRELVFEIWDDCATDAIGARARRLVETLIRERFPEGTSLAYTTTEIQRLNERRLTAAPFDPYGPDRDAG